MKKPRLRLILSATMTFLWLASCAQIERRPALSTWPATGAVQIDQLNVSELSPFLIRENYPEFFFAMNFSNDQRYELEIKRTHASEALQGIFSCDAPFLLKEGGMTKDSPGPSQVYFEIPSEAKAPRPRIVPSSETKECRLFMKDPKKSGAVYGLRLIPRPLVTSDSGKVYPAEAARMPASLDISQIKVSIPDEFAFKKWNLIPSSVKANDPTSMPKISIACDDGSLYPTHPQQTTKQYHLQAYASYDHHRLEADHAACAVGKKGKTGRHSCLRPDSYTYALMSDLYQDRCGNLYRGFWETVFFSKDENMGTLFSRGRALRPNEKSQFANDFVVSGTHSVAISEFIFFTPIFPGDLDSIQRDQQQALQSTHTFNKESLLFERIRTP